MGSDSIFQRHLLFVSGKGGVGKTSVSQAIALRLNRLGKKVLWATFQDPFIPTHRLEEVQPGLFHINCEPTQSFEEYAAMKIGVAGLAKLFLSNKLMRYLSNAAPGIHELVLLGKVWYERQFYDHVIVDMPSTGYGIAMFQSTRNFARLFRGGPIHRDTDEMLKTFSDPKQSGQLIVSIPEEMPLQESLELNRFLLEMFPENPPSFLLNRRFPELSQPSANQEASPSPVAPSPVAPSPVAKDAREYAFRRTELERMNLKIWDHLKWSTLSFEPSTGQTLIAALAAELEKKGIL